MSRASEAYEAMIDALADKVERRIQAWKPGIGPIRDTAAEVALICRHRSADVAANVEAEVLTRRAGRNR